MECKNQHVGNDIEAAGGASRKSGEAVPYRQVRAAYNADTITVYQAYSSAIAEPAITQGTFVPPFKRERMTWIKPSFRWMGYRSGWGTKPNQERVLAIEITREGFEWALANSCLSAFDADIHPDAEAWQSRVRTTPVRIQWDPERGLKHQPLPYRSIQIGLRGGAVHRYVDEWITSIREVTGTMFRISQLVSAGDLEAAGALLPVEEPYPLSAQLIPIVGASPTQRPIEPR